VLAINNKKLKNNNDRIFLCNDFKVVLAEMLTMGGMGAVLEPLELQLLVAGMVIAEAPAAAIRAATAAATPAAKTQQRIIMLLI
jgi:hypothetical protein